MTKVRKGSIILEQGNISDITKTKKAMDRLDQFSWKQYTELAQQRDKIQDEIKKNLIKSCLTNYEFKNWQRAVKYKYSLHPLSSVGSWNFIGGRFNAGKDVNLSVPFFQGLYLAEDKDTALQEHLGQVKPKDTSKLTAREIALTTPDSESIICISGKIDKVFDLTTSKTLSELVNLFSKFSFSSELIQLSKTLKLPKPEIVDEPKKLLDSLLDRDWRLNPLNNVPSNSQIFGHLVYAAEIEGILYPSKFTKKLCLVLFPKNFPNTESYIQLNDEVPHPNVPALINARNWRMCELTFEEINKSVNNKPL
jgi:hypothetical protein